MIIAEMHKSILIAAVLTFAALPVFAEFSDHGKWEITSSLDARNIFFSAELQGLPPLVFNGGEKKLTFWGTGAGITLGYDADGWLFGIRYGYASYYDNPDRSNLMETFENHKITLSVSKILNKGNSLFLPNWLDMRVEAHAGVNIITTNYVLREEDRSGLGRITKTENPIFYGFAIAFELGQVAYATPFLNLDFSFMHDMQGTFFVPSFSLGFRLSAAHIIKSKQEAMEDVRPVKTVPDKKK